MLDSKITTVIFNVGGTIAFEHSYRCRPHQPGLTPMTMTVQDQRRRQPPRAVTCEWVRGISRHVAPRWRILLLHRDAPQVLQEDAYDQADQCAPAAGRLQAWFDDAAAEPADTHRPGHGTSTGGAVSPRSIVVTGDRQ